MRQVAQPGECCLEFLKRSRLCEITGVNQDISVWNVDLSIMSIGDADDRDWISEWCSWNGFMPTVKLPREEHARFGPELLPWSRSLSVKELFEAEHGKRIYTRGKFWWSEVGMYGMENGILLTNPGHVPRREMTLSK
jgi:hypothetical protein